MIVYLCTLCWAVGCWNKTCIGCWKQGEVVTYSSHAWSCDLPGELVLSMIKLLLLSAVFNLPRKLYIRRRYRIIEDVFTPALPFCISPDCCWCEHKIFILLKLRGPSLILTILTSCLQRPSLATMWAADAVNSRQTSESFDTLPKRVSARQGRAGQSTPTQIPFAHN